MRQKNSKTISSKKRKVLGAMGILILLALCTACGGAPAQDSANQEAASQDAIVASQEAGPSADTQAAFDMEFHRGGRDARAENTLYAYQYALENGATTIECDMQMTKDGQLIMGHNPVLNPDITTDADGRRVEADKFYVADMTLEELQKYNVGKIDESCEYYSLHGRSQVTADARMPTLRELFELVRDSGNESIRMSIEAKYNSDPAMESLYDKNPDKDRILEEFLSLVKEFGFEDRVLLQSLDWDILVRMQKLEPRIETVAVYNEEPEWGTEDSTTLWLDKKEASPWLAGLNIHDFDEDPVKAASSLGINDVSPYWEELTPDSVREAHELGMKVIPWTINNREAMDAMYSMGVDGMITDKPWVMREFLESRGETLNPKTEVDLPYHLDPDHIDVEDDVIEGGRDAAF